MRKAFLDDEKDSLLGKALLYGGIDRNLHSYLAPMNAYLHHIANPQAAVASSDSDAGADDRDAGADAPSLADAGDAGADADLYHNHKEENLAPQSLIERAMKEQTAQTQAMAGLSRKLVQVMEDAFLYNGTRA